MFKQTRRCPKKLEEEEELIAVPNTQEGKHTFPKSELKVDNKKQREVKRAFSPIVKIKDMRLISHVASLLNSLQW